MPFSGGKAFTALRLNSYLCTVGNRPDTTSEQDEKFIDIERLIASKNPKALKWTPSFVINYLKRKLHQDEINQILIDNKDNYDFEFCHDIIERFNVNVVIEGAENIPTEGGAIFVVNHPLGGMDAMAIMDSIAGYRRDVKFIVNDLLMNLKNLNGIFAGVNLHGKKSKESLNALNELFASEQAIFIFPAGLVSRRKKGEVKDVDWKTTFISKAQKFDHPVVPVHLDGQLTNFFYNLANFRTKIGIKLNIEMLYLADELFKQRNKTIRLTYGKPIPALTFDRSKTRQEWAQWVKDKVYQLPND